MLFSNSLLDIQYKGYAVYDILKQKYDIEKFDNGVLKVGNEYVNVVYASELDEILNKLAFGEKGND